MTRARTITHTHANQEDNKEGVPLTGRAIRFKQMPYGHTHLLSLTHHAEFAA